MRLALSSSLFLLVSTTLAQTNGKFETGSLSGWTVELGQHNVATGCGTMDPEPSWWSCPMGGWFPGWGYCFPPGPPGVTIYTASSTLDQVDPSFLPDPYQGSYMALLNDLSLHTNGATTNQGYHACRMRQTFTMSPGSYTSGAKLGLEWGAILEDPGHSGGCQPWFKLSVTANSAACGTIVQELFVDATDAANAGWLDISLPSVANPFYYKHDVWCVDLSHCGPGATVTVEITAADCAQGLHAGCAFLDNVRFLPCTPPPAGMVAWWDDDSGTDIALANDFTKVGTWLGSPGSGKVGTQSAMLYSGSNYAEVPCHPPSFEFDANQGFAYDTWVRASSSTPFHAPLFNKTWRHAGLWNMTYDFYLEDRYLAVALRTELSGGFLSYVCTNARVPIDEWAHIAVSVDRDPFASEVRFYLNGERRSLPGEFPTNPGGGLPNQNGPFNTTSGLEKHIYLGYSKLPYTMLPSPVGNAPSYFVGRMDEFEFFNRALSDAEVLAVFQSGCRGKCKSSSPLVGWGILLPYVPADPPVVLTGILSSCCKLMALSSSPVGGGTTWTWDGRTWMRHAVSSPPVRGAELTFDDVRDVAVLVVPDQASSAMQVWEWIPGANGGTWSRAQAPNGPPAIDGHAAAFDSNGRRTLVFGGRDPSGASTNETWSWDGMVWQRLAVAQPPSPRHAHTMAYDVARDQLVLFGGQDSNGRVYGDTWMFDGQVWTLVQPPNQPSARSGHAMVYDPLRERVILYGGADATGDLEDVWEWDGRDWIQHALVDVPPARRDAVMAFDATFEKVVLMGGTAGNDGMWYYGSRVPASTRPFGSSCPGTGPTSAPSLHGEGNAWIGSVHEIVASSLPVPGLVSFSLGLSNTNSPYGPLPLNLGPLGLHPTCELLADPFLTFAFGVQSPEARLPVPLPNDTIFLGLVYYAQVVAVNPVTFEVALTNGLEFSVGQR